MCGIAGIFSQSLKDAGEQARTVREMTNALKHRGPDRDGQWVSEDGRVAFGHRRLSIIDLTDAGRQPMRSASGRYVLTYNGEIYNFQEIRDELLSSGKTFSGGSDTEVLLASIEQWGLDKAVRRIEGMFAFALWDKHKKSLSLVRDHLGIKPLFYSKVGDAWSFASEVGASKTIPGFNLDLNPSAVEMYTRLGYVPTPFSIFRDSWKVPAGSIVEIDASGKVHSRTFWSAKEAAQIGFDDPCKGSFEDISAELETVLLDSVRSHMVSDVPIGAFLSGGIDSSLVARLMTAINKGPVSTFTIGFEEKQFDEVQYAREISSRLGSKHHELRLTHQDALALVPKIAKIYDEPFADSSQIPTFLVSKLAREHVTVVLSGDGGDELFAGYNRYSNFARAYRMSRVLPTPLRNAALGAIPRSVMPKFGRFARVAKIAAAPSIPEAYFEFMSSCPIPDYLLRRDFLRSVPAGEAPADSWASYAIGVRMPDELMCIDQHTYLADDILTKVDRASMAVSLESRVPLLSHKVAEFAWRVRGSIAEKDAYAKKSFLVSIAEKSMRKGFFDRPKQGFAIPINAWLRGPLKKWGESLLLDSQWRDDEVYDPKSIAQAWSDLHRGRADRAQLLWTVLMFRSWQQYG